MPPKSSRNKSAKTETIALRVSPKIRYGLELLARKKSRTLSSIIEWALIQALNDPREGMGFYYTYEGPDTYGLFLKDVWDTEESDRLIKLFKFDPTLFSYEEELAWKVICNTEWFWDSPQDKNDMWHRDGERVFVELVRKHWDDIQKVVTGNMTQEELNALQVKS